MDVRSAEKSSLGLIGCCCYVGYGQKTTAEAAAATTAGMTEAAAVATASLTNGAASNGLRRTTLDFCSRLSIAWVGMWLV